MRKSEERYFAPASEARALALTNELCVHRNEITLGPFVMIGVLLHFYGIPFK